MGIVYGFCNRYVSYNLHIYQYITRSINPCVPFCVHIIFYGKTPLATLAIAVLARFFFWANSRR